MSLSSWILQNSALAGLLAGIVLLACRIGKLSPVVRHALWLVVLLKLLTPPVIYWPWGMPSGAGLAGGEAELSDFDATDAETEYIVAAPRAMVSQESEASCESVAATENAVTPSDTAERGAVRPRAAPWWATWIRPALLGAWFFGAALLGFVEIARILRLQRLAARAVRAPREIVGLVRELSASLGVRPPAALIASGVASPLLWSLGRPKLILPISLLGRVGVDSWRGIIAHELAHLKRRDHWIGWLELAGELVWWWNPVYWFTRREIRDASELCCDAWVVWALPEGRKAYAEALIEVCQLVSNGRAPAPALGLRSSARGIFFKRRLTMILLESAPRRIPFLGIAAAGLLACAVLPGWSQEESDDSASPLPPTPDAPAVRPAPVALPVPAPKLQVSSDVAPVALPATAPKPAKPSRHAKAANSADDAALSAQGFAVGSGVLLAPPKIVTEPAPPKESADRLADLEKKLRKLSAEVDRLRTDKESGLLPGDSFFTAPVGLPGGSGAFVGRTPSGGLVMSGGGGSLGVIGTMPPQPTPRSARKGARAGGGAAVTQEPTYSTGAGQGGGGSLKGQSTVLIRTKYYLPQSSAEALASFLKEHVDGDLDVQVKGDSLTITSDESTNVTVSQIVSLMARRAHKTDSDKPRGGAPSIELTPGGGSASTSITK